ncbi:MAG: hypothetical protein IPP83_04615 [Flavobacteriales bacterium]|nr:hypothetical protein [Flavobacteriales bacterium]
MSRFEKRVLLVLGLLILGFASLEAVAPKPTDWTPSYSKYHSKPFGGKLLYERLADLFPNVRNTHDPIAVPAQERLLNEDISSSPLNHIFINSNFGPDKVNTESLLEMVEYGDRALIAAERIHGTLADTLHLDMDRAYWMEEATSDIRFIGDQRIAQGVFRYARHFPGAYFTRYDTSRTRVLAVDGASRPVLLEMTWGEGRIVLCSAPRALSNYNLLKNNNATFAAGVLSVLPSDPVLWDEYYKVGRMENTSIVRFLLKEPALRWAWFIALALIALFMIVYSRRQQRAIPIVTPLRNATRELANTIGRLYWHQSDHAGLARMLITHFKEEIRARTYLRTFAYDAATIDHLATKTGRERTEIASRLAAFERREQAQKITEADLLVLNTELHEFRQLIH